ncbi:response regulator [Alsobacter soli]|nr:response regulator [Alsobacter soli]
MPHHSRVLLVEDGLLLRFMMAQMLENTGFVVIGAGDADEALSLLEADSFAIVVSDIDMPGEMDGVELAHEIRSRWPEVPVILISGEELPSRELPDGCPFLPKPVPDRLLVALMREMIARASGH